MNSYSENQMDLSVKKINGKKMHSKDFKIIPLMYGKKTTKKIDLHNISGEMADYCTQLFFLS